MPKCHCGRKFKTRRALQQHQRDTGHGDTVPKRPPFEDAVGKWVARKEFIGRKSFGIFRCPCQEWLSAHAFKHYRQECKACGSNEYATFMWVNSETTVSDGRHEPTDKPHLRHLCEACKQGVCRMGS